MSAAIEIRNLSVVHRRPWPAGGPAVTALDRVSLSIAPGEIFGLVGESGSGKSTLARVLLRFLRPAAGSVSVAGADPAMLRGAALKSWRRRVQPVFQDSVAALDPRARIGASLREGLDMHAIGPRSGRAAAVAELLEQVGLDPDHAARYPHQLSGGQRQRVAIARALSLSPEILIADEPVSALDLSVQAQILGLLTQLCRARGMTMLFISHDLGVVRQISDRIGVLRRGGLVEEGPVAQVFRAPRHPYTRDLLAAAPFVDFEALRRASVPARADRSRRTEIV